MRTQCRFGQPAQVRTCVKAHAIRTQASKFFHRRTDSAACIYDTSEGPEDGLDERVTELGKGPRQRLGLASVDDPTSSKIAHDTLFRIGQLAISQSSPWDPLVCRTMTTAPVNPRVDPQFLSFPHLESIDRSELQLYEIRDYFTRPCRRGHKW